MQEKTGDLAGLFKNRSMFALLALFLFRAERKYNFRYIRSFIKSPLKTMNYLIKMGVVKKIFNYEEKKGFLYALNLDFVGLRELKALMVAYMRNIDYSGIFGEAEFALVGGLYTATSRKFDIITVGEMDESEFKTRTLVKASPVKMTKREVYILYLTLDPQFTQAYEQCLFVKRLKHMAEPRIRISRYDTPYSSPVEELVYLATSRLKSLNSLLRAPERDLFTEKDRLQLFRVKQGLERLVESKNTLTSINIPINSW